MPYRIFISHGAADRPVVDVLEAHARAIGIETYLFEREVEAGRSVSQKLQEAIRGCDAVVALLTEASSTSPYVHQEIGYALGQNKLVLPLVDRAVHTPPFAMLDGAEYIPIDPASPSEATARFTQSLHRMRGAKENQELVMTLVILGLLVLLVWSQTRFNK